MKNYKILFVYLGNICRSPMAEYVPHHQTLQAGVTDRISADSAGTPGWHDDEDMHRGTCKVLAQHGINHSGLTSSKIRKTDGSFYDFIIAMDDSNLNEPKRLFGRHPEEIFKLTDLIPENGYHAVPDPWYTGDFDETFRLVDAGYKALLHRLGLSGYKD